MIFIMDFLSIEFFFTFFGGFLKLDLVSWTFEIKNLSLNSLSFHKKVQSMQYRYIPNLCTMGPNFKFSLHMYTSSKLSNSSFQAANKNLVKNSFYKPLLIQIVCHFYKINLILNILPHSATIVEFTVYAQVSTCPKRSFKKSIERQIHLEKINYLCRISSSHADIDKKKVVVCI